MTANQHAELLRAGPGTGKTYQLSHRFAQLVANGHDPARIAVVTFTRAAAASLRERVRDAMVEAKLDAAQLAAVDDAPMLTIDAFSNWILRMSVNHRSSSMTPLSQELGLARRNRRLRRWLMDNAPDATRNVLSADVSYDQSYFGSATLLDLINSVVEHPGRLATDDWFSLVVEGDARWPGLSQSDLSAVLTAAADFAREEAALMRESGQSSYEDTTRLALDFVRSDDGSAQIRDVLSALLVDELQDTDPLQEELFKAIWEIRKDEVDSDSGRAVERFLVGDLKQAIYQFRNADPRVMERFLEETPADKVGELTTNRRSAPEIVNVLNQVAKGWFSNEPALDPLDADAKGAFVTLGHDGVGSPSGSSVKMSMVRRAEAIETAAFLRDKRELWSGGSCAVLMPTRNGLYELEDILRKHDLPVLNRAASPYDSPEVEEVVALLTAISDPSASTATIGALRGPAFAIDDAVLDTAINATSGTTTRDGLLASERAEIVAAMGTLADYQKESLSSTVGPLVEKVVDQTGLWDLASDSPSSTNRLHWLINQAFEFDREVGGSLGGFVLHLDALSSAQRTLSEQITPPHGEPVIQLMTMHGSKGLEFDTVVINGLANGGRFTAPFGRWIHNEQDGQWNLRVNLGKADSDHQETAFKEKQRLLYVALSRAKKNLIVALHHAAGKKPSSGSPDPCTMLREALATLEPDTDLVKVVPETEETFKVIAALPQPSEPKVLREAVTVTSVAGTHVDGSGKGAEHGDAVHVAVSAALNHYSAIGASTDELLAAIDSYELAEEVAADAKSILKLPTIADAVSAGQRIESEYPVAGVVDGSLVHGIVDVLIFAGNDNLTVADIKTDIVGERDPVGTLHEKQLDIYRELVGASSQVLLGPR